MFQGRYKSILVEEDSHAVQLSAYIHLNPVRGGMVNHPGDYQWSSYLDYMGKGRSFSWLDTQFILAQFDDDLGRARKKYENYVLNNLIMENPLKDSYKGIALGGEGFIEKIKEKIQSLGPKREIVETKDAGLYTPEEIIQKVMAEMSINREEIFRKRKGNFYRQMTLYLLKKHTPLSLKEIGKMFQMDYAAVSQACKRYEEGIRKN